VTANHVEVESPLYVDLDGTLVASDTLWELLIEFLRERPWDLLRLPFWLLGGRARFKSRIAGGVQLQPEGLPYRPEVLELLREARDRGRRTVLATASDVQVAAQVARHLALFDDLLASDGDTNLKGSAKADAIEQHAGGSFEYAGNSAADLPVWSRASRAILVAPSRAATRAAERLALPTTVIGAGPSVFRAALHSLRPHQWVKNALLFVPLILAHNPDRQRLAATALAFLTFCACASATYLLNDLVDIRADRRHPRKRKRPLASGSLPIPIGLALSAGLLVVGFACSMLLLPARCTGMLAIYLALTTAYSLYLKQYLFIDVLLLAGLYTHRVVAGGVVAQVPISPWLLAFSMFFFVSLAFAKRCVELLSAWSREEERLARRSYRVGDTSLVENMGLTSGYLSVLVIGLYVTSSDVTRLYPSPELLWLICPVMLYWITRIWFLAHRGDLSDDPVLFAVTDLRSYVAGAMMAAAAFMASLEGLMG
jgi:4-hydroxybenzoate polyprenyltransferase